MWFKPKKLELNIKYSESPPTKPSIEEDPKLELKALPPHLRYVFLGKYDTLPIIIASDLNVEHVECGRGVKKGSNEPLVGL